MDTKASLTRLLTLLSRTVIDEDTDQNREKKRTDVEETAALLHLNNGNFSNIALALDELSSLNLAATEFNNSIAEKVQYLNYSFEKMHADIDELSAPPTAPKHHHLPVDPSPSSDDIQLVKQNFATEGFEDHLKKMKIFPYNNTIVTDRPADDSTLDVDLILSSKQDDDAIWTLQTIDLISKRIAELRSQNDIKEEQLNLEHNYHQNGHLIGQPHDYYNDNDDHNNTFTRNIINEIKHLETECLQMDEELSRILREGSSGGANY